MTTAGNMTMFSRRVQHNMTYDAEVEYLESAGNQFINTEIKALSVTGLDMTFTPLASKAPGYQCYLSTPSNTDFVIGRSGNTAGTGTCYFRFAANKTLFANTDVLSLVNPNRIYIDQDRKWIVNGTDYGTINADVLGTVDEDMNFGGIRVGYGRNGAIRLYCIKLYGLNGILVRDMIPVRFTNELEQSEGAMYDRVSGKLFRNAGADAFTVGPDKYAYLRFDFRQSMVIPPNRKVRNKLEVLLSFDQEMSDGTRRIPFGGGGSAKAYLDFRADGTFPGSWTTNPPLIVPNRSYLLGTEGMLSGSVSITMDGSVLATDFICRADDYFAIGSYGQNTNAANFSGRILEVYGYDTDGNVINHYLPYVSNGRPCLYDIVGGGIVYSETGKEDPIYGVDI